MKHKKIYIVGIILIALCPLLIAVGTSADILNWATNENDWIGFWAEYFGTITGSLITLLVLWWTIKDNKEGREREEKVEYYSRLIESQSTMCAKTADLFNYMVRMHGEKSDALEYEYKRNQNDLARISIEVEAFLKIKRDRDIINKFLKKNDELTKRINKIIEDFDVYKSNGFKDMEAWKRIDIETSEVLKELPQYMDDFSEIVTKELEE